MCLHVCDFDWPFVYLSTSYKYVVWSAVMEKCMGKWPVAIQLFRPNYNYLLLDCHYVCENGQTKYKSDQAFSKT